MGEITKEILEQMQNDLVAKYKARFAKLKGVPQEDKEEAAAVTAKMKQPEPILIEQSSPAIHSTEAAVVSPKPIKPEIGQFINVADAKGDLLTAAPVRITGSSEKDGVTYYQIEGTQSSFPESHIEVLSAEEQAKLQAERVVHPEIYGPPEPKAERKVEPAKPAEIQKAVQEELKLTLEEKLKQANLSPEEKQRFEAIINNKNLLDKAADFAEKKLKSEKLYGLHLDFAASFAATAAMRLAMRHTLETLFSIGGGAVSGAIIGGTFRGFREWRKAAKEQYAAGNWGKELEGKDGVELANTHAALVAAIKDAKVKGDKEQALSLVLKLRDVESRIGLKEVKTSDPLERLANIMERRGRAMGTTALTGEKEKLYREFLSARRMQVVKKAAKGAVIGGLIGAAGGAAGHFVGEYIHEHLGSAASSVSGLKSSPGFPPGVTHEIAERVQGEVAEAKKQAMLQTVERAIRELPNKDFTAHAESGEGVTHIARKFVHDYLVQQHLLMPGQSVELTREQLVYAEDLLRRQLEDNVQPGDIYGLKGTYIVEAISHAQHLAAGQTGNLKQQWIGKISEKVWGKILDYSHNFDSANDYAGAVKEQALAAAEAVDKTATALSGAGPAEAVKERLLAVAEEAVQRQAPHIEKTSRALRYLMYGALGIGAGAAVLGFRYRGKIGEYARGVGSGSKDLFSKAKDKSVGGVGDTISELREQIKTMQGQEKQARQPGKSAAVRSGVETFGPKQQRATSEELKNFLLAEGFDTAEKRKKAQGEAENIARELHEKGVAVHNYVFGEKYLAGVNNLQQALEGLMLTAGNRTEIQLQNPDYSFSDKFRPNQDRIYLSYTWTPQEMRAKIEEYFNNQTKQEQK